MSHKGSSCGDLQVHKWTELTSVMFDSQYTHTSKIVPAK